MKSLSGFFGTGFLLVSLVGISYVHTMDVHHRRSAYESGLLAAETIQGLDYLRLAENGKGKELRRLLKYQRETGKTLSQILREPEWGPRLGVSARRYKATWYMANPFDVLPTGLQEAIRQREIPFKSRTHVWQWCRTNNVPAAWRKALYAALIETTPYNLWRASRGQRPYTRSGAFLEPLVVDHGSGRLEVRRWGHIATDPAVIPTNSNLLLMMTVDGRERLVKVKAADTGGAIRGKHVDLPIHLGPDVAPMPHTLMPLEIRNPFVEIVALTVS